MNFRSKIITLVGVSTLIFSSCTGSKSASTIPDFGSDAWYTEVETRTGIVDAEGHGPDRMSSEWCGAVERKLSTSDNQGGGPDLCSEEWLRTVHFKLFNAQDSQK